MNPVGPERDQRPYWDRAADGKEFTHPINAAWLRQHLAADARILDYGCGYGRTLHELASLGYVNTVGVDFAPRMIARGRRGFPALDLRTIHDLPLPEPDGSFDAVLLLAVLTCIPDDGAQARLIREVRRLLRPGGLLFLSDMPLQADARNQARYADAGKRFAPYGVFETGDGAVVRHHGAGWPASLLVPGLDVLASGTVPLRTMNGHAATGLQVLARRSGE